MAENNGRLSSVYFKKIYWDWRLKYFPANELSQPPPTFTLMRKGTENDRLERVVIIRWARKVGPEDNLVNITFITFNIIKAEKQGES